MSTLSAAQLADLSDKARYILDPEDSQTLVHDLNALLDPLITNTFAIIEHQLGVSLLSTAYTGEVYDVPWTGEIILRQAFVSIVDRVFTSTRNAFRAKYTGTGDHAWLEVRDDSVQLRSRIGATDTENNLTFASNASVSDMVTAIAAITGWTATQEGDDTPSVFLERVAAVDMKDREIAFESWEETQERVRTKYDAGIVKVCGKPNRARIDYTAGASSMPAIIEQRILDLVKAAWNSLSKDLTVESEKLGDYAYKLAAQTLSGPIGLSLMTDLRYKYGRKKTRL